MTYRLEVLDTSAATCLGVVATVGTPEIRVVLRQSEAMVFRVRATNPVAAHLVSSAVLRLVEEGTANVSLWRVRSRKRGRDTSGSYLDVEAHAGWNDLRRGLVSQAQAGGRSTRTFGLEQKAPLEWIRDVILPGFVPRGISFAVGDVHPTTPVTLQFDDTARLEGLRMLEQALQDADGAGELSFRLLPDGRTYAVDLLPRVGRSPAVASVRYARNLHRIESEEDADTVATRLYARGAGILTLADAEWTVATVSGGVVTFAGASPVFEVGAFVGLWFYVPAKATGYPITASSAAGGSLTLTTAGRPALVPGDVGRLATTADGLALDYLESPAGVAEHGVIEASVAAEDIPDAANLIPQSDLSTVVGSLPAGVTLLGTAVVSQETALPFALKGSRAWRVVASADGDGFLWPSVPIAPTSLRPYTGALAEVTPVSGRVRLELRHSDGVVYPKAERKVSQGTGVYTHLGNPVHDAPLPAGTGRLALVAHDGPAEFVVDAVMLSQLIGGEVPEWVPGQAAHLLWKRAAGELARRRGGARAYRVDFAELDGPVAIGDEIAVLDPEVGAETVRVTEYTWRPGGTTLPRVVVVPPGMSPAFDPLRLLVRGQRIPGRSPWGDGPGAQRSRVTVSPSVLRPSASVATVRLAYTDPDRQVTGGRFYFTDAAGLRSGPHAPTRSSAGVVEYDAQLHPEKNVGVDWEIVLADGDVIGGSPGALNRDTSAQIVGIPNVSDDGPNAVITTKGDSDCAELWREEKTAAGWQPPFRISVGREAVTTVARLETGPRVFRDHGRTAAGAAGLPCPEFTVGRYVPNTDTQYAQCTAKMQAPTATQIPVVVTGGASVQLVAVTGSATLASGPGIGVASAPGTVWTFNRGAALGASGEAVFRATGAGLVSDDDSIIIPEQGRDTVAVALRAEVVATTPTQATIRVRGIDPYPQGTNSLLLAFTVSGLAAPANANPTAVTPTSDFATTATLDYVVQRPAFGSGTGRINFIGTAPNRVSDSDSVDIPAVERDTQYAQCVARMQAPTATQVPVVVTGGTSVELVAVTGSATLASGPGIGVASAPGTVWTFNRGAEEGPAGAAAFRASGPGLAPDEDDIVIPEQGRDTVALRTVARLLSQTATDTIWRVRVIDPHPQGTGYITLTWAGGAAGVVTLSPAASEDDETGGRYADVPVPKPAKGAGMARTTFTGTAANRVPDSDPVDVQAQESVTGAAPRAEIEPTAPSLANITLILHGALGEGGTAPLRYRTRTDRADVVGTPTGWVDAGPSLYATLLVVRDNRDDKTITLELEDAAGRRATTSYRVQDRREYITSGGEFNPATPVGTGGDSIGTVRDRAAYARTRTGLGGSQYEVVTSGNFRSWDPDFSTASGVNFAWGPHTVRFGGDDVAIPSGSFSGLPGNTVIYPWYDRGTGGTGCSLTAHGALGHERVPLGRFTTVNDVTGFSGGGSDPLTGSSGGGTTAARPPAGSS